MRHLFVAQFIGEELNMINNDNDKGNIGIITDARQLENLEEDKRNLYKIVDKLENRISKLEKVLESHAKCIGELREDKNDIL